MTNLSDLFKDLVRAETRLYNAIDARLREEHSLSLGGFEFLDIVESVPACRVSDIVATLGVTVGAVSKGVDRLERAGLLVRAVNPGDRRSSILSLTPAGDRVLRVARPTVDDELAASLGGLVPIRDLQATARVLAALRERLEMRDSGGRAG